MSPKNQDLFLHELITLSGNTIEERKRPCGLLSFVPDGWGKNLLARISDIYKKYIWRLKMALQKSFFKFKLIYTNVLLVIRLSSKIFSTDKMQSFNYILHYIYLFILETFVPTTLKYLQYWIWDSSVYLL